MPRQPKRKLTQSGGVLANAPEQGSGRGAPRPLDLRPSQEQAAERPQGQHHQTLPLYLKENGKRGWDERAEILARDRRRSHEEASTRSATLWSEKHAPGSVTELKISKKKVDEVRKWLSKWLPSAKRPTSGALLVLRGPPGCGKRELVRLLAAEIGFSVCEYVAPLASSWGEFEYAMRDPESRYVRPIDHFQDFLMHAIHLPMLSLGERGGSGHGKVVLVRELPHTHDPGAREVLSGLLADVCDRSRFPVVLVVTENTARHSDAQERGASSSLTPWGQLHRDVSGALEAAGAADIELPAVTDKRIGEVLEAVARAEGYVVDDAELMRLAESSGGDVRAALMSLQVALTGVRPLPAEPPAKRRRQGGGKSKAAKGAKRARSVRLALADGGDALHVAAALARDPRMGSFHAVGRILYNKRADADDTARTAVSISDTDSDVEIVRPASRDFLSAVRAMARATRVVVAPGLARRPMERDPDAVVGRSGLGAEALAGFLLENYHEHFREDCFEEMAGAAESLSDAMAMVYHPSALVLREVVWEDGDGSSGGLPIMDAMAASVAARGYMFHNLTRPANSFRPTRGAALWSVSRAEAHNREELARVRAAAATSAGGFLYGSLSRFAAEYLPFTRFGALRPARWASVSRGEMRVAECGGPRAAVAAGPEEPQEELGNGDEEVEEIEES